jgi:hypothetical protein
MFGAALRGRAERAGEVFALRKDNLRQRSWRRLTPATTFQMMTGGRGAMTSFKT